MTAQKPVKRIDQIPTKRYVIKYSDGSFYLYLKWRLMPVDRYNPQAPVFTITAVDEPRDATLYTSASKAEYAIKNTPDFQGRGCGDSLNAWVEEVMI